MATDYDTRRKELDEDLEPDSIQELKSRRDDKASGSVDMDETEVEAQELPGAELPMELSVVVVPKQTDEFVCNSCFLVKHRSQLAKQDGAAYICKDCAD